MPDDSGKPTCLALIQSRSGINPDVAGWAPSDFQTRYNLPSSTRFRTDRRDRRRLRQPERRIRSRDVPHEFGLGTANFTKYNQNGQQSNYPRGSAGWGVEIDLDVQMVSAVCPHCTIYLVEANSSNTSDLETAEANGG